MERISLSFFVAVYLIFACPVMGQKRVLLEKYTSAYCGNCANAHLIAYELKANNPELILVFHHSAVDGMATEHSAEWREGLNVLGTPYGMVDRVGDSPFNLAVNPVQWENKILDRLDEPEVLSIDVEGTYEVANRKLEVEVAMDFSSLPPEGELRLNVMVVEDSVIGNGLGWDQSNYFNGVEGHPLQGLGQPIYDYPHNNVLRAILDGTWGTTGVFPEEINLDAVYRHRYIYMLPEEFNERKTRLVVSVSMHDEDDLLNRQVLNANEFHLFGSEIITDSEEVLLKAGIQLEVYPNPARDHFWINTGESFIHHLELLDQTGRPVQSYVDFDVSRPLSLERFPAGVYLLRVKNDKNVALKKIVVQ